MTERKHARITAAKESGQEMLQDAQRRVTKALRSDKREDAMVKALFGAVGATLVVRLIRQTPIGAIVVRLLPIVAFVGLYDAFAKKAES